MRTRDELLDRMWREDGVAAVLRGGRPVVVGVSGGPDSMALLHMMKTLAEAEGFAVVAAHVNHRFRGAESDAEAELVRRTAGQWGLACDVSSPDVPAYIASTGMNAQAAARELRYACLREAARRYGAAAIALAHHADDQAETVLMRVLRGTGIGGLAGIPIRRSEEDLELIRPLLRITKQEIVHYCERNGVPYAVDSSNAARAYFRNRVRLDVMPVLERYNPRLRSALNRLAEVAGAEDDYMEERAAEAYARLVSARGSDLTLERRGFRSLHVALQRRVIKLILNCLWHGLEEPSFERIEELAAAVRSAGADTRRLDAGGGVRAIVGADAVRFGRRREPAAPFAYSVPTAADLDVQVPEAGMLLRFRLLDGRRGDLRGDPRREVWLDADALAYPLAVRSRLPGDRLSPAGLTGSKKVQDMFVDAKVPREDRDRAPLLADAAGRVLWIPGLRRSRLCMAGPETARLLHVRAEELGREQPDHRAHDD